MDVFAFLTMLGGLCLFLFGMNLMGEALERRAGNKNAKRTALGLTLFFLLRRLFQDALALPASLFGIAATHHI